MGIRRWAYAAIAIALAASAASACGGSDSKKTKGGLEKTDLKIAVLPIVDDSPVFLARKYGYFKQEGLTVTPITMGNGAEALARMQSGAVDMAFQSYANLMSGIDGGAIKARIVADGYATAKHLFPVQALPNSGIKKPTDLVGKKVAINAPKGLGPLLLATTLKPYGVSLKSLKLVPVEFPSMGASLQNHSVDAAWINEPFATQAAQKLGTTVVLDSGAGPADGLPIAGYATSETNAKKYPKTMAAFQRAISKAQSLAADRSKVEQILPSYAKGITPQVASTITIGTFPTTLSPSRLQRVPDLMLQFGMIKKHIDVNSLLLSQPK